MTDIRENALNAHFRKHGTVHLLWTIFILLAAVVALASFRLGTDSNVKDILNFAVALSSLLLALVAIVQALISNGALGGTIAEVHRALASVSGPAERLNQSADFLNSYSRTLGDSTQQITASLDAFKEGAFGTSRNESVAEKETFTADLLSVAPVATLLALYVVLLSKEKGIPFINLVPGIDEEHNGVNYYIRGFVGALIDGKVIGANKPEKGGGLVISDFGELSWLPSQRSKLLVAAASGSQEALTAVIAKIDKLAITE